MEKENLFKTVGPNLRSVVLSSKGGVFLDCLEKDYRELLGTPIPYRKMGFDTLEAMLKAMPTVVRLVRDGATQRFKVIAVADESTEHIQKMISKQRDSKSKSSHKRFRVPNPRISSYNQRRVPGGRPPAPRRVLLSSPPSRSMFQSSNFTVNVQTTPAYNPPPQRREQTPPKPVQQPPAARKGLVIGVSNYEVPPRFLKQHKFQVQNCDEGSGRSSPSSISQPQTTSSSHTKAPPVTTVIPSPVQTTVSSSMTAPSPPRRIVAAINIPELTRPSVSAPVRAAPAYPTADFGSHQPKPVKSKRLPVSHPPLPSQLSAKERVKQYAATNGLQVEYKTKSVKKGSYYLSVLQLGDKKFHSIHAEDNEKRTEQEAEELAASMALEYIEKENKVKFPETSLNNTENIQTFVARIEMIVSEKLSGVWSHGMQSEYENRYQESLPENWLSVVETNTSIIEFERPENLNIPNNACILRVAKMSSGGTTPTSTSSRTSFCLDEDQHQQILPYINSESTYGSFKMPPLVLPETKEWFVTVCCVASVGDVSVRLLDYNVLFTDMVGKMNEFYSTKQSPVHRFIRNKTYAALDEGIWHRVVVEDIKPDTNQALCHFVDHGIHSLKSFSDLRELDPTFETLPFQALHITLHNLEHLSEKISMEVLEKLLDRTLIAVVHEREPQVVAELYDTSGEDDVPLNKVLMLEAIIPSGSLPEVNVIGHFYLVNVSPDGILSLTSTDLASEMLSEEMQRLAPTFEKQAGQLPSELDLDKVYAVNYPVDGMWCRALPTGFTEPAEDVKPFEVEMYFIDYGNTLLVPLSSVAALPNWLAELPRLAQECILTGVPPSPDLVWTQDATNKLYELAPDMEPLTVRVDEAATDELPAKVNLFKRSVSGEVISINNSLAFNEHLFSKVDQNPVAASPVVSPSTPPIRPIGFDFVGPKNFNPVGNPLSGSIPDVAVPASVVDEQIEKLGSLQISIQPTSTEIVPIPPAVIPALNQEFDVYVAMAASPSNFVVQPLRSAKELTHLLGEMKAFYTSEEDKCDMHPVLLKKGDYYAVHYSDGEWYRAKLTNLDEDHNAVTVHLVDFGDFWMTSMANLQPLWKQFKSLPCQAVKASLAGVKPRFGDWEPEECLKFREYVEEKVFVSTVVSHIRSPESDWSSVILGLKLIDTSNPDEDVHIDQVLIQNKLAIVA